MTEAFAVKPCPFCGGEAEIVRKGTARSSMQISCTQCNTHTESGDVFGLTPSENWQWNRRVPVTVSEKGEAESNTLVCPRCHVDRLKGHADDFKRLIALAEERVMIQSPPTSPPPFAPSSPRLEGIVNKCKGCPYYLRVSNRLAICVWDQHPENPTGCDDKIVRFYRASLGAKHD